MTITPWEVTAASKRKELQAEIEATGYALPNISSDVLNVTTISLKGLLEARQVEITSLGPVELVQAIASGTYTAVEVTVSCQPNSLECPPLTDALRMRSADEPLSHMDW
jgi:hypothetical protein